MKNELFREIVSTVRYQIDAAALRTRAMTRSTRTSGFPTGKQPPVLRLCHRREDRFHCARRKVPGRRRNKERASVVAVLLGVTEGGSKLDRMSTVYEDAKTIMDLA
jgi:hypothetical protein